MIKSKSNSKNSKGEIILIPKNENICCDDKTPCASDANISKDKTTTITTVQHQQQSQQEKETEINIESNNNANDNVFEENHIDSHKGENTRSKDKITTAIVLVKLSGNNKDSSMEMTNEQYNSWTGNENENEI